jgi:hypothetical protein
LKLQLKGKIMADATVATEGASSSGVDIAIAAINKASFDQGRLAAASADGSTSQGGSQAVMNTGKKTGQALERS